MNHHTSPELTEAREEMINVAGFRDPSEAQMARGMLESAGIECIEQGENANELFPGALQIWLQVKAVDEAAARALLADAEASSGATDGVDADPA